MKEVGISWNLLVVGVEEDSELLVISDLGGSEVNLVVMIRASVRNL